MTKRFLNDPQFSARAHSSPPGRFSCRSRLSSMAAWVASFLVVGLFCESAQAHLRLNYPSPRHSDAEIKSGPCGVGPDDSRTTDPSRITTLEGGSTITVTFTEFVDHDPAHYRIAFSRFGDDEFFDPEGYDDIRSGFPILLDGIVDADAGSGHDYEVEVILPDISCDACTLQVIQVMHDKPPFGPEGGEDIYYQCADLILVGGAETVESPEPMPGVGGAPPVPVDDSAEDDGLDAGDEDGPGAGEDREDAAGNGKGAGCAWSPIGHEPRSVLFFLVMGLGVAAVRRRGALA